MQDEPRRPRNPFIDDMAGVDDEYENSLYGEFDESNDTAFQELLKKQKLPQKQDRIREIAEKYEKLLGTVIDGEDYISSSQKRMSKKKLEKKIHAVNRRLNLRNREKFLQQKEQDEAIKKTDEAVVNFASCYMMCTRCIKNKSWTESKSNGCEICFKGNSNFVLYKKILDNGENWYESRWRNWTDVPRPLNMPEYEDKELKEIEKATKFSQKPLKDFVNHILSETNSNYHNYAFSHFGGR